MAQTIRSAARRAREDLYVALVECLHCGAPAGQRCTNATGQYAIMCCQIRADLAQPMARAILELILLLRVRGWLTEVDRDLPAVVVLGLLNGHPRTTGGTL